MATAALYTHEGKTLSAQQWADLTGVSIWTIRNRLRTGRTIAEAIGAECPYPAKRFYAFGQWKTLLDWADFVGMRLDALAQRLRRGWPFEEALTRPLHYKFRTKSLTGAAIGQSTRAKLGNREHTLREWAAISGVAFNTIRQRLESGWSIEAAITLPSKAVLGRPCKDGTGGWAATFEKVAETSGGGSRAIQVLPDFFLEAAE